MQRMGIEDFKGTAPVFLPEEFLIGRLEGWAVLESLVGGLQKRATISATGEWDIASQTVALTETYTFDDGHTDTLHWMIRKNGEGRYSDTAAVKRCWTATQSASRPDVRFTGSTHATCRKPVARTRS
jgi:hypothetical protein